MYNFENYHFKANKIKTKIFERVPFDRLKLVIIRKMGWSSKRELKA